MAGGAPARAPTGASHRRRRSRDRGRGLWREGEHPPLAAGAPLPPGDFFVSQRNLNDGSVEGLSHRTLPAFSVQYHPEGSPGPQDNQHLYDRFVEMVRERRPVLKAVGGAALPEKPKNVLILGSGPIVIGQAAEFDYAGTQACKALREEGIATVLVNSNPATIMTDEEVADRVYLEPLTVEAGERGV